MKDHIIDEKEDYKDTGLSGFDYKLFEEEEGGGTRKGLDRYNYLKHIIQLWSGDWVKQTEKINEEFGMKDLVTMNEGGKRVVCLFKMQEFWKCFGFILLAVTYGKKGHKLWSEIAKYFGNMENPNLRRDVYGNTNLFKVCCAYYRHFYICACH